MVPNATTITATTTTTTKTGIMPPFRRPGLAEDDVEERPEPSPRPYALQPCNMNISMYHAGDGDESVVSGLSAQSDLESVYLESSSNQQNIFLQCQLLPGSSNRNSHPSSRTRLDDLAPAAAEERQPKRSSTLLMPFNDDNDDDDNWEDLIFAATNQSAINEGSMPKSSTKLTNSDLDDHIDKLADKMLKRSSNPTLTKRKDKTTTGSSSSRPKRSSEKLPKKDAPTERRTPKNKSTKKKKKTGNKEKTPKKSKKKAIVQVEKFVQENDVKENKKSFLWGSSFKALKSPEKKCLGGRRLKSIIPMSPRKS